MISLFRKNRLGVGSWRIWWDGNLIYIAHATTHGGSEVIHTEEVPEGLAGRTLDEQIQSRINSRIKRQRDKGYVDTVSEALNNPLTNMLDQPPPMLAKKLDQLRGWEGRYIMQPKLDGFRCMITRANDKILAYTRGGIELPAISHITKVLDTTLPDDFILDGEIYSHGVSLQTIASLAKRQQPGTFNLVYHVYDSVSSQTFEDRYSDASDAVKSAHSPHINLVENSNVTTVGQMWEKFGEYRAAKYEGGMLRSLRLPYESGTRSSGLIKVKARDDGDFVVKDVHRGSDGLGILECVLPNGRLFKTLAPGNHDKKREILDNKDNYIGRKVTVEYANLTADGIPFHGVAIRFVEEL